MQMCMQCACNVYAICMENVCNVYAICMQCECIMNAMFMRDVYTAWNVYSGVFNNCAAHLINFSENSNLHTLIKDLHIYLFLRITPTCTFIMACTIIDIAKFLAQSLIFSSKLNNFQLILPYSIL